MPRRFRFTPKRLLAALAVLTAGSARACPAWWVIRIGFEADRDGPAITIQPVDEGFVGSRVCADCHAEIWKKFQRHPMSHSLTSLDRATPIEDYVAQTEFQFPESRHYRAERAAEQIVHHESMVDATGDVLYDQAVAVQYALGSGKRGRSYLFNREGQLYVSPISWYTTANRWDIAPGYEPLDHPRFERRAIDKCLACHAGRMVFDRRWPDRYGDPPFLEESIGCERCHGPGAGHVNARTNGDKSAGSDSIVNPAKLDPATREDVCNQCHLTGDVRVLRNGKSIHDFRPGQRLEEVWAILVGGTDAGSGGTTRAVNQVQQMRGSNCYQASGGKLSCLSCHDPHDVPDEANRTEFYNARCLNCHHDKGCSLAEAERTAPPAKGSCIACHMSPLVANNIPHAAQTDHRIVRRSDLPPPRASRELVFFDRSDERLPPREVERAQVLAEIWHPEYRLSADELARMASQLAAVTEADPRDVTAWVDLGNIHALQKHTAEAGNCWRQALRWQPWEERALKPLANLQARQNDLAGAIATARRLVRANPWQAESHTLLAQFLDEAGEVAEAVREVEQALAINPTLLPDRSWLAAVYRKLGRTSDAEREERLVERMRNR